MNTHNKCKHEVVYIYLPRTEAMCLHMHKQALTYSSIHIEYQLKCPSPLLCCWMNNMRNSTQSQERSEHCWRRRLTNPQPHIPTHADLNRNIVAPLGEESIINIICYNALKGQAKMPINLDYSNVIKLFAKRWHQPKATELWRATIKPTRVTMTVFVAPPEATVSLKETNLPTVKDSSPLLLRRM